MFTVANGASACTLTTQACARQRLAQCASQSSDHAHFPSPARRVPPIGGISSGSLQAKHRQRQVMGGDGLGQQIAGHVQAGTAGSAATGTHGQPAHRGDAIAGGLPGLVLADSVPYAEVGGAPGMERG